MPEIRGQVQQTPGGTDIDWPRGGPLNLIPQTFSHKSSLWSVYRFCDSVFRFLSIFSEINGEWGDWVLVGTCTATCGQNGKHLRTRLCNNPAPSGGGRNCPGDDKQRIACNLDPCPGKINIQANCHVKKGKSYKLIPFSNVKNSGFEQRMDCRKLQDGLRSVSIKFENERSRSRTF